MRRRIRHLILLLLGMGLIVEFHHAQELLLPLKEKSVRFAVMGDSGSGKKGQYELAQRMVEYRQKFPFEFVIMLGDNIYGTNSSSAYTKKFELPYKPLLDGGVKFYAALGNHDNPDQPLYMLFNMQNRYYTYTKGDIRLFVLDSNYMDPEQLKWLERELQNSGSPWKICYFHHPLYSSGGAHGSDTDLRGLLEPLFVKYGVNVVFAGHDHFYERVRPQKGIYYFTSGSAGQFRRGDIRHTEMTAKGFDQDLSFMIVEVSGDELHFQVISRTGSSVDAGMIQRTVPKVISSAPKLGGS